MTISNGTVAQLFAEGATKGCSKNMYIDGDVVYSYGSHFPIARRIEGGYIFNSNSYSVSTATHKSIVCGCIAGHILWELPGCNLDTALEVYADRVYYNMKEIIRSKKHFPHYLALLEHNFERTIKASKTMGQDIQYLYTNLDSDVADAAIRRIKKEGKLPSVLLTVFGRAKFLNKNKDAVPVHRVN